MALSTEHLRTVVLVAFFMAVGPALMILNKEILDGVSSLTARVAEASEGLWRATSKS